MGLKTSRLLLLGMVRFLLIFVLTIVSATLILYYHQEILNFIWTRPESRWLIWLWHVLSWLISLILVGAAGVISYLVSQVLLGLLIMDYMSRITERMITGQEQRPKQTGLWRQLIFLLKQEIPRTTLPVLFSLAVMAAGWLTPAGPLLTLVFAALSVVFLTWDFTDLVPARRMVPFSQRLRFLSKTLPFHLGFGLPFLIPAANILFLAFAPVGATLYYLEKHAGETARS